MFKKLFENYRRFLAEDEAQLLIEARETDALKRVVKGIKNEGIQEFLTSYMDQFLNLDPSGNQKYALWVAKILNSGAHTATKNAEEAGVSTLDQPDFIKNYVGSIAGSIRQNLALYHKLTQRNLIEKDINKFSNGPDWAHAVYRANKELEEKERMKALEKQAKSETEVLESGDDYMMVRPTTKEGSCYFGQGTRWCISATQSQNYFDSYTGEGKGFYFVFFHHLPQGDDMKKMALVFEPGYDEPSEVYDRPDDEVGMEGLISAVEMNLMMKGFWESLPDKKKVKKIFSKKPEELSKVAETLDTAMNKLREDDILDDTLKKVFEGLGIDLSPESTNEENMASHAEQEFEELVSEEYNNIIGTSAYHWDQNPAGPTEEEYQRIEDEHDLQHFYVSREEMDEGRMYWDAGTSFQFDDVDDLVEDAVDTDTLRDFVDSALDSHYIYGEVEDNSYGGSIDISVRINPDHGESEGLEGFSSFMETVASADKEWQNVYDAVIDMMKDAGWIPGESMKALLQKFDDMDFQNFEVELEDGKVQMSSRLPVKILLPDELKTGRVGVPSMSGQTRGRIIADPRPYINRRLSEYISSHEYASEITKALESRLEDTLDRALEIAASQLKLPLKEEKAAFKIPTAHIQMGVMGPQRQRSGTTGHSGTDKPYDVVDTIIYWLDVLIDSTDTEDDIKIVERFLKMIDKKDFFEKIRQYVEGLVNNQVQKQILPRIRKELEDMKSAEATTDELVNLFEGWRRFLQ